MKISQFDTKEDAHEAASAVRGIASYKVFVAHSILPGWVVWTRFTDGRVRYLCDDNKFRVPCDTDE